mmetsp:Transcript_73956/g.205589  ORF Transcript_73956/g.205589 Transcript_73956/m.205589 type:complete len:357 (+) Transcript_73956:451-1521(+)
MKRKSTALRGSAEEDVSTPHDFSLGVEYLVDAPRLLVHMLPGELVFCLAIVIGDVVVPCWRFFASIGSDSSLRRGRTHHLQTWERLVLLIFLVLVCILAFLLARLPCRPAGLLFGLDAIEVKGFREVAVPCAHEAVEVHDGRLVAAACGLHDLHLGTHVDPLLIQTILQASFCGRVPFGHQPGLEKVTASGFPYACDDALRKLCVPFVAEARALPNLRLRILLRPCGSGHREGPGTHDADTQRAEICARGGGVEEGLWVCRPNSILVREDDGCFKHDVAIAEHEADATGGWIAAQCCSVPLCPLFFVVHGFPSRQWNAKHTSSWNQTSAAQNASKPRGLVHVFDVWQSHAANASKR